MVAFHVEHPYIQSMRKIVFVSMLALFFIQDIARAQDNTAVAGAVVGATAMAIAVKLQIDQIKEQLEQKATEWVLLNEEMNEFNLKLLNFEATKINELNRVSAYTFIVKSADSKRGSFVLLQICSYGWVTDYGIDHTKIKFIAMDKIYWKDLVKEYLQIAGYFKVIDIENIPKYFSKN